MDSLRARLPVSGVVGKRVILRRHGREFIGLCPFHKEKSPSFTVNDEKGFFHCFGCGVHGDAIGFVKDYEHITYREAVERLAAEAGLEVPRPDVQDEVRDRQRKHLVDIQEAACRWFESQLAATHGYIARQYLAERGLSEEIITRFRVGYAPGDREALKKALMAQGVTEKQLVESGLLVQAEGRAPYSRFRDRIIFPIRDRQSKVIAFGGRLLPGSSQANAPKYLNSPETELFHKGEQLYNFDLARTASQQQNSILLCEGYMDVIALAQAGIAHCVAPLGTAVTQTQLQLLWQCADEPVLCLDGDVAGQRAAARAGELALPMLLPGKSLKFARLPEGHDPDSLVRAQGREALLSIVDQAPGLSEMFWRQVMADGASTPEARAGQEQRLMQLAERIADATVKSHYRTYFKQRFWETSRTTKPAKNGKAGTPRQLPDKKPVQLPMAMCQIARECLVLVLFYPQLLADGQAEEFFATMALDDPALSKLQTAILDHLSSGDGMEREDAREHLSSYLKDNGHEPVLAELSSITLRTDPRALKAGDSASQWIRTRYLWNEKVIKYYQNALEPEKRQAEAEMSAGMNDEREARTNAIKMQLQVFEKEKEKLYQQMLLQDEDV